MGFKVREEFIGAEVLESGGVVRHHVGLSRDVRKLICVAVVTLVEAGEATEVCRRAVGGDSTADSPAEGRCVVRETRHGELTHVVVLSDDVLSNEESSLLEVTVGDVPVRVVEGDDSTLDVLRERNAP